MNCICIEIVPLNSNTNIVKVKTTNEIAQSSWYVHNDPKFISDQNLSLIVRKMALHADMTARIYRSQKDNNTVYGGKWYDRLKQINRIRKLVNEHNAKQPQQQQQQQQQQAQHMQQPLAAFQRIARFNTANQVVGPAASNSLPPPLASSSSAGSNLNQMNFTNYI